MTPEEITNSLKNHIDKTHRKMSIKDYLSLRHIDVYTNSFTELLSGKMNKDEFKKEFSGEYRSLNEDEVKSMKWPKTIAPIFNYRFNEMGIPIMEQENVQITD